MSTETVLGESFHFLQGSSPRRLLLRENFHFLQGPSLRQSSRRLSWEKFSISCKSLVLGNVQASCHGNIFHDIARVFFSSAMSTEVVMGGFPISYRAIIPAVSTMPVKGKFSQGHAPRLFSTEAVIGGLFQFYSLPNSVHGGGNGRIIAILTKTFSPAVSTEAGTWENFQILTIIFSPAVSTVAVKGKFLQGCPRRHSWGNFSHSCEGILSAVAM